MIRLFGTIPAAVRGLAPEELKNMELYNYLGNPASSPLATFDEILTRWWTANHPGAGQVLGLLGRGAGAVGTGGNDAARPYLSSILRTRPLMVRAARHENPPVYPHAGGQLPFGPGGGIMERQVPALEILLERETDAVSGRRRVLWLRERGSRDLRTPSLSKTCVRRGLRRL